MPKMSNVYNLSELVLNRTVGVEMEGYVTEYPNDMDLPYTNPVKSDGSLRYQYWEEDNNFNGVEITTEPLNKLNYLEELFTKMESYGWNVTLDDNPGTHVHVDISDFSMEDKLKLLWFGKKIEHVMFLFVKKYRRERGWCHYIHTSFDNDQILDGKIECEFDDYHDEYFYRDQNGNRVELYNEKCTWMNVFASHYPTAEFRLFHAIENKEELVKFAYIAHNLVEVVKNSTTEQLGFIIQSLQCLHDAKQVGDAFCRALGLNFRLAQRSKSAQRKLEKEWNLPAYQERVAEREAQNQQRAV